MRRNTDFNDAAETLLSMSQRGSSENEPETVVEKLGTPPQSEDEFDASFDNVSLDADHSVGETRNGGQKTDSELARVSIHSCVKFLIKP